MKTTRMTVSLLAEQLELLQQLAAKHALSLAWLIRQAINEFLDRTDQPRQFHPLGTPKRGQA